MPMPVYSEEAWLPVTETTPTPTPTPWTATLPSTTSTSSWNEWAAAAAVTDASSVDIFASPTPSTLSTMKPYSEYGYRVTTVTEIETPTVSLVLQSATTVPGWTKSAEKEFKKDFSNGVKAAIIVSAVFGAVAIIIASIWFCCGKPRRKKLKAQEEMQLHRERMEAETRAGNQPLGDSVQNLGSQVPVPPTEMVQSRHSIAPVQARGAVGVVAGRHVSLRGGAGRVRGGSDAPPSYEEIVPATHQRIAGGMNHRGMPTGNYTTAPLDEEDGEGMVADGKMPLSEIPFEDVVLDSHTTAGGESSSSGSSFREGGRDFESRHAEAGGDTTGHSNV